MPVQLDFLKLYIFWLTLKHSLEIQKHFLAILYESTDLKSTYQSWTLLNDSSFVTSYMRMNPIAPR